MDKELILKETEKYIKERLGKECTGHDWWHVYRVWKMALRIANEEENADSSKNIDLFVVQLAALLHDIADYKMYKGNKEVGPRVARKWLEKIKVQEQIIDKVCKIIAEIDFRGIGVKLQISSKEGKIVQDADWLDAIGAIGIARAFAYGGYKEREIYNPKLKPKIHKTFEEYKNSKGNTINHFYEKLLLLKDLMNTETAKKIAEERHRFMEKFLDEFFKEWEVEN